jgi:hypothetical protein
VGGRRATEVVGAAAVTWRVGVVSYKRKEVIVRRDSLAESRAFAFVAAGPVSRYIGNYAGSKGS